MMRKTRFHVRALIVLAMLVLSSLLVFGQAAADKKPAEAKKSILIGEQKFAWQRAKKWTLAYIDAMPADAVNFKPTPEIRSFAEQMLHLSFWNFGITQSLTGKPSPHGMEQQKIESREDLKNKAALRKFVEESYDYVLAAIAGTEEAKLTEQTEFFGQKVTRLMVLSIALDHQTHHRGQTTLYLRLKGVTPPPES